MAVYGENHPDVADCYYNIAAIYYKSGELDKALEVYERSLGILLEIYDDTHINVAVCYMKMSEIYRIQGNKAKFLDCLKHMYRIMSVNLPEEHSTIISLKKEIESLESK